jgi:hypothetical protein
MNRRLFLVAVSETTPKINLAQAYLELRRLRRLVQEAERSLIKHGVNITPIGSGINAPQEHRA